MKEQDLSLVFYDMQTVRLSMQDLSDSDLYDNCLFEIQAFERDDLDKLYDKLAAGGKLTPEERVELEKFYTLVNVSMLVKE